MLLTFSVQRSQMLPDTLSGTGQSLVVKNFPVRNVTSTEVEDLCTVPAHDALPIVTDEE